MLKWRLRVSPHTVRRGTPAFWALLAAPISENAGSFVALASTRHGEDTRVKQDQLQQQQGGSGNGRG